MLYYLDMNYYDSQYEQQKFLVQASFFNPLIELKRLWKSYDVTFPSSKIYFVSIFQYMFVMCIRLYGIVAGKSPCVCP